MIEARQFGLREITTITKVEQVCRAILRAICAGELLPGERLVEAVIAKTLGVSQATVNQAFSDLDAQGIVRKDLNRATTVACYGPVEIGAVFRVRKPLESMAMEAASRAITPEAVADLRVFVEEMGAAAKKPDLPRFVLADYEFHQAVYRISQNQFLYRACQAIAAAPFAYILCSRPQLLPTDYSGLADDHQELLDALRKGPKAALRVTPLKLDLWRKLSIDFVTVS